MSLSQVRVLHLSIDVPMQLAYAFACRPENFARGAAGLSKTLHHTERGWIADTPEGEATVTFKEPNDYGVLDHRVAIDGRPEILIPLRMIPNGDGTEVELVLIRQPGMTDEQFAQDAHAVEVDLQTLRRALEAGA